MKNILYIAKNMVETIIRDNEMIHGIDNSKWLGPSSKCIYEWHKMSVEQGSPIPLDMNLLRQQLMPMKAEP